MAWVKVPPENHAKFYAALPVDPLIETKKLFGGVAAKANGVMFAGLFGRSTMVLLPEDQRAEALALEGASWFDPMGDGRGHGNKIMLPERMMNAPDELRHWLRRAFAATAGAQKPTRVSRVRPSAKCPEPRAKRGHAKPARRASKKS